MSEKIRKELMVILIIFLFCSVLIGCSKKDDEWYLDIEEKDNYSVEREQNSFSEGKIISINKDNIVRITNELGEKSNDIQLELKEDEIKMIPFGIGIDKADNIYVEFLGINTVDRTKGNTHEIWKFNNKGEKLKVISIKENDTNDYLNKEFSQIYILDSGEIVYLNDNGTLIKINDDGTFKDFALKADTIDYQIFDGIIYGEIKDNKKFYLIKKGIDNDEYDFKIENEKNISFAKVAYNKQDKTITYISDRFDMEMYDENGKLIKKIGSEIEFSILAENIIIENMLYNNDKLYMYYYNNENDEFNKTNFIKKMGLRPKSNKTVIKIGVNDRMQYNNMKKIANEYMRSNKQVAIKVVNYMYEKEFLSDYLKKINTKLISGDGENIIATEYLPMSKFIKNNILEDLSKYMEADNMLNSDDYYQNILKAYYVENKCFAIPYEFVFSGILSDKDKINDINLKVEEGAFSMNKIINLFEDAALKNKEPSLSNLSKNELFKLLFKLNAKEYIDEKNSKTSFNSLEFDDFITNIDKLTSEEIMNSEKTFLKFKQENIKGNLIFEIKEDINLNEISILKTFIPNYKICPLPNENKTGYGYKAKSFAIPKNAKNKEESWKFLKYILDNAEEIYEFKVNKKMNEKVLDYYASIEKDITVFLGEDNFIFQFPIDEKNREEILNIINNAEINMLIDPQIENIFEESINKYVNNEISLDEFKKSLDNKISIYLEE